jgi:hypothetical protein
VHEGSFNNTVKLRGMVAEPLRESHVTYGERFYATRLRVPRLSHACDLLPVTISERLLSGYTPQVDSVVTIIGQLRSYNQYIDGASRLILTVFAKDIIFADTQEGFLNYIALRGHICKPPIYRTTPFGREIADILLAVNRAFQKSDYIPCIAWGRFARYAQNLRMRDMIGITGRMQSRIYEKALADGSVVEKTAYEVSIGSLEKNQGITV